MYIKASFDACYRLEGIDSEEEIGSEEGFLVTLVVWLEVGLYMNCYSQVCFGRGVRGLIWERRGGGGVLAGEGTVIRCLVCGCVATPPILGDSQSCQTTSSALQKCNQTPDQWATGFVVQSPHPHWLPNMA